MGTYKQVQKPEEKGAPFQKTGASFLEDNRTNSVLSKGQESVGSVLQRKGKVNINDDKGLEKEADVMGAKALQMKGTNSGIENQQPKFRSFPHDPVQFTLMGGLVGAALGLGGALATIGTGGAALAVGAGVGLLGHYMTNQSEVNTPWRKNKSGVKNVAINLYYSPSLLGHFTILMTENDKTTRIHFVLKEEGDGSMKRKVKQVSGYAKGQVNIDENINDDTRNKYGGDERPVVSGWKVDGLHALKMMNFLKGVNKVSTSYGYIVYSNNVDNCGSMVLKALAQAGISVTLPRWKQWHQLPSFIKDDIK
ncbi:MAG: hypothetical protein HYZ14_07305 [Bacteroidetes bacterium]|nr:hypothetical protein [Bacteroidota bacterium]